MSIMRIHAKLLIPVLLILTLLTLVGCTPTGVIPPEDIQGEATTNEGESREVKSTDDTQDEIPAETKSPEDIPADIVWADPAVKYIIYSVYLNDDEFSAFCDENHDAASDQWNSPEGFWAFVDLFDAYIEKKIFM